MSRIKVALYGMASFIFVDDAPMNYEMEPEARTKTKKPKEEYRIRNEQELPTFINTIQVKSNTHCSARSEKEKRKCHNSFSTPYTNNCPFTTFRFFHYPPLIFFEERKKERRKEKKLKKGEMRLPLSRSRNVHSHVSVSKLRVQKKLSIYSPPPLLYIPF